jgi:hypothetical protein
MQRLRHPSIAPGLRVVTTWKHEKLQALTVFSRGRTAMFAKAIWPLVILAAYICAIVALIGSKLEFDLILVIGFLLSFFALIIFGFASDGLFKERARRRASARKMQALKVVPEDPAKLAFDNYFRVLSYLPAYDDWSNLDLSDVKLWESTNGMGRARHKKVLASGILREDAVAHMLELTKGSEIKTTELGKKVFGRSYEGRTVAAASVSAGSKGSPQATGSYTRETLNVYALRSSNQPARYDLVSYIYEDYEVID